MVGLECQEVGPRNPGSLEGHNPSRTDQTGHVFRNVSEGREDLGEPGAQRIGLLRWRKALFLTGVVLRRVGLC